MTWATFVPILVFLDLSVLELGPIYANPRGAETAEPIEMKLIMGDYVGDPTPHAQNEKCM